MLGVRHLSLLMLLGLLGATGVRADESSPWYPGSSASGDDTFIGFIDAPLPGAILAPGSALEVRGWVIDATADGWSGIDQILLFSGSDGDAGRLLATAHIAQDRQDVALALDNPFFAAAGFSATVTAGALPAGQAALSIAIHTPNKGWWYRPLTIQVQPPAALPFSNDLLLVVEAPLPNDRIALSTSTFTVRGFALDRNAPPEVGVGGSGVSHVLVYVDGPRRDGLFLGEARLGVRSPQARGFGQRFSNAGWDLQIHPKELTEEPHALFIYALAATPSSAETLQIVPFRIGSP